MNTRELLLRLSYQTGILDRLARASLKQGRFALMFHGVASVRRPGLPESVQPYLDAKDLMHVLRWLSERCELLDPAGFLSGDRPGVLLSFDDGYSNNHSRALPVLKEWSAPAVFFVATQHVANARDWLPSIRAEVRRVWASNEEVPEETARDLFDGLSVTELEACAADPLIEIGSHTISHPLLTGLDNTTLLHELTDSRRQLEDWTGESVRLLAYPTGDYDHRVASAARDVGFTTAFADSPRSVAPEPAFEIPRIGLYRSDPWYLAAKMSGLFRRPLPVTARS